MRQFYTTPITDNEYYIGAKDRERGLFDSLIPLPQGTTYNADTHIPVVMYNV
jgi:flavorubredoxin